jgi:hypothetical protein
MNKSMLKYDVLRAKYTGAYVKCLELTGNLENIRKLSEYANASQRDLTGYFHATARHGGVALNPKLKDSTADGAGRGFVYGIKRVVDIAISKIIMNREKWGILPPPPENKGALQEMLGLAYEVYLSRYNGGNIVKGSTALLHDKGLNKGSSVEIDAVVSCFREYCGPLGVSSIDLDATRNEVLSKCHDKWPSKAMAYSSTGIKRVRKKKAEGGGTKEPKKRKADSGGGGGGGEAAQKSGVEQPPQERPQERPDPPPQQPQQEFVTFVVVVPAHLNAGDTMKVTVGGFKSRLVVPNNMGPDRKIRGRVPKPPVVPKPAVVQAPPTVQEPQQAAEQGSAGAVPQQQQDCSINTAML